MIPSVKMGKLAKQFNEGIYQDITISVTEECNLRCKYCYISHKNGFNKMSIDIAKKIVDYVLTMEIKHDACVWNFVGGEPTLEIDLIDEITDYIVLSMYNKKHPWFNNQVFMIGTNGVLYKSEKVQNYIKKNTGNVYVAISIDGNKQKHDTSRVKPDGSGSYDEVVDGLLLLLEQFPGNTNTKSTFSSDDLPYLKDSIIHLWSLGIDFVAANVVFEDVWKAGDNIIFETQLKELADYIITNEIWNEYSVRFFDPHLGYHTTTETRKVNYCGTGKMICFDVNGNIYPCLRFLDFCMDDGIKGYCIGTADSGIDKKKLKTFESLSIENVSPNKCKVCPVASGCFSCTGNNYNYSHGETVHIRTTFNCEMHMAQARANKYFWKLYTLKTNNISPFQYNRFELYVSSCWNVNGLEYLYILTNDALPPFCEYTPFGNNIMSEPMFSKAIEYAYNYDLIPIIVTDDPNNLTQINYVAHMLIFPADIRYTKSCEIEECIPLYTCGVTDIVNGFREANQCILNVTRSKLYCLENYLLQLKQIYKNVVINRLDKNTWTDKDLINYDKITYNIKSGGVVNQCDGGVSRFTLAPDGNFYACPAFYYMQGTHNMGNLKNGINDHLRNMYNIQRPEECKQCEIKSCRFCIAANYIENGDLTIPSDVSCYATICEKGKNND